MFSENTTVNIMNKDEYLSFYDNKYAVEILPAMLLLSALMLTGFIGNSLVCFIYLTRFKNNATRCYILALAVFDLLSCLVSIPIEIIDMRHNYTFGSSLACKCGRLVIAFSALASGTVLVSVAGDRYRKICTPLKKQTSEVSSKIVICVCTVFSFLFSLPATVLYGSRTVTTDQNIFNGTDCSTADEYLGTPYPLVYNGTQFLIFFGASITMTVLYILIWRRLQQQRKFKRGIKRESSSGTTRRSEFYISNDTSGSSGTTTSESVVKSCSVTFNPSQTVNVIYNTGNVSRAKEHSFTQNALVRKISDVVKNSSEIRADPVKRSSSKTRSSVTRERKKTKLTFVFFLITLVFILSFLPHLALMAARALHKHLLDDLTGVSFVVYHFFLRSYFINSAVNPIIYGFCNAQFRVHVKYLFKRCLCRR